MTRLVDLAKRAYWWMEEDVSRFQGVTVRALVRAMQAEPDLIPLSQIGTALNVIDTLVDAGLLIGSGKAHGNGLASENLENIHFELHLQPAKDWESRLDAHSTGG